MAFTSLNRDTTKMAFTSISKKEIIFSLTAHMTYHLIYTLSFELIIDTILLDKTLKDI